MFEGREVQAHFSGFLESPFDPDRVKVESDAGIVEIRIGVGGLSIKLSPAKARELAEGLIRELNKMELEKETEGKR
jgi:hypothetical protein